MTDPQKPENISPEEDFDPQEAKTPEDHEAGKSDEPAEQVDETSPDSGADESGTESDLQGLSEEREQGLLDDDPQQSQQGEPSKETQGSPVNGTGIEDDEMDISISDDELWDDGSGLEEIPLFDDEEDEGEEDPAESQAVEAEDEKDSKPSGESDPEEKTQLSEDEPAEATDEDSGKEASQPEEGEGRKVLAVITQWLPWIITGISGLLLITGIIVLWVLWPSSGTIHNAAASKPAPTKMPEKAGQPGEEGLTPSHEPERRGLESISLAPFLIPAQNAGELVFFKLHVELIVPDIETKRYLLRKEAWLRDAIYQELKGITVKPGKGNLLLQYRRPILERLNAEFKPFRIEDIRLSGYLLK